jgi:hypothetical protein
VSQLHLHFEGATLNDTLRSLGLTTCGAGAMRQIMQAGAVVFEGRAHDVWRWLRATGRIL